MAETVLITDIQRFSVNDGPGFRTNVYLKGCSMRCAWCHNPETMAPYPEIYWKSRLCVQCGKCLEVCPRDAIEPPVLPERAQDEESGTYEMARTLRAAPPAAAGAAAFGRCIAPAVRRLGPTVAAASKLAASPAAQPQRIIRSRCDRCMRCVEVCLYDALQIVGKAMSVEEILEEVLRDQPFYDNSGGGMTLSGGEPAAHAEFAQRLLKQAKDMGLNTCLDTNGFCEWEAFREIVRHADLVLYDLKHLDPALHQEKTGVDNEIILKNLARLAESGKETWVRIPVIPDFNDSLEFHAQAAEFLAGLPGRVARVDLLPFHNWCQDKYGWLGVDWNLREIESLDPVFLEIPAEIYREKGLNVTIGGSGFEKF